MSEPTTKLDPRFSDADGVATPWEESRATLEDAELFWISTVRQDGRPHVTPLVAVWMDDALFFSTGDGEQKAVNLRSNSNVVLTTGRNSWNKGLDVMLEGDARLVRDVDTLKRVAEVWTTKWDGRWTYHVGDGCFFHELGDESTQERINVYMVAPIKVFAFSKGSFAHTRYTF
ncbi:MAG TPA: pyridoxamine 5'-phosphate oxidase family protein [Acidimicrobiales bacterium]